MQKNLLILLSLGLLCQNIHAQMSGEVNLPELGVRFTIPAGWVAQESGDLLIMGSNTEPGFILMFQHEYTTLEAIRQGAEEGIYDEGVSLQRNKDFENINQNGIGAEFAGTIQNQPAKAYLVGLINPFGAGVTIMAATESAKFSDRYKQLALALAKSVQFSKLEIPAAVQQWKQELMNKRLYYRYSYSSNINGYTGSSETEEIWLCASGHFDYKSSSHDTFDTGGAFGYGNNSGKGAGTWEVVPGENGVPVLQLHFQNGKINTYSIDGVQDGKLYLSGYKYFWANAGDRCR